nr:4-(2'-carboxyphenyl)-4-oxybutyric acid synthase [Cyanidioschyzonaceae sp. 2]
MRIHHIRFYSYRAHMDQQVRYGWFCQWVTSEHEVWSELCSKFDVMELQRIKFQILQIDWNWASILSENSWLASLHPSLSTMIALVIFHLLKKKKKRPCIAINALAPKFGLNHVCVKWKAHQNWKQSQHAWMRVDFNRHQSLEQFLSYPWDWTRVEYVEEPVDNRYALEQLQKYPIALDESLMDWYKSSQVKQLPQVQLIIKSYRINSLLRIIDMVNRNYAIEKNVTFTSDLETHVGIMHQINLVYWMNLKTPMGFDTVRWIQQIDSKIQIKNEMVCDTRLLLCHHTT